MFRKTLVFAVLCLFAVVLCGGCTTFGDSSKPSGQAASTYEMRPIAGAAGNSFGGGIGYRRKTFYNGAVIFTLDTGAVSLMDQIETMAREEKQYTIDQIASEKIQKKTAELGRSLTMQEELTEQQAAKREWSSMVPPDREEELYLKIYLEADEDRNFHISNDEAALASGKHLYRFLRAVGQNP